MDYTGFFKGKRVTVVGLGLLGRGVGDAAFIAAQGGRVTVTDTKSEEELKASVERLRVYPNIVFHLGGHQIADFTKTDMVMKAAGVRLDSKEIEAARRADIPVYMSTALCAKFAIEQGATIIGVTGTRGKSTVAHMVHHVLKETGRRAHLGGNIRGLSTLSLIPEIRRDDVLVLELDSWQLQGFGDFPSGALSPHIAIFTNLMPDHQNYYRTMSDYFLDKANIFKAQRPGDVLIAGKDVAETWIQKEYPFLQPEIPAEYEGELQVLGEHNRQNAALAAAALRACGVPTVEIERHLKTFAPVEGRLQFVRELHGIKVFNDNNATTPEATVAALHAVSKGKNVILIAGGADKGLDMSSLLFEMTKACKRVILLAGSGTDRLVPMVQDYSIYDSLESAVEEAAAYAKQGDVILFSPAFASFGMFQNEYERNDRFMKIIATL